MTISRRLAFASLRASLLAACLLAPGPLASPLAAAPIPVGGRVIADRDQPVAGARVALVRAIGSHETGVLLLAGAPGPEPATRAVTDREGRFELAAPEAGMWKLTLEAKGYLPLESTLEPLLDAEEVSTAKLTPDLGLDLKVVDEAGRPLAARLFARPHPGEGGQGWRRAPRLAAAGADGTARLPRGAGERLRVFAAAPDRPPARLDVAAAAGRIVLGPGVPRPLRALDERGRPAAGAVVWEREEWMPLGLTGADGRWVAAAPPGGELTLRVEGAESERSMVRLAPLPAAASSEDRPENRPQARPGETTIRLESPRTVTGRVLDRASRRPLPGALVWMEGLAAGHTRADRAGVYSLRIPRGVFTLEAAAPGYLRGEEESAGRSHEGPAFALLPAGVLDGVVLDPAGRPAGGVEVRVALAGGFRAARWLGGAPWLHDSTRSTSAGRFRLAGVPAGLALELAAGRAGVVPGYLAVEALRPFETRSGLRLSLGAGRPAAGQVVDREGRPVAGAEVRLSPAQAPGGPESMSRLLLGDDAPRAWTDPAGRFALAALAPGRYDLAVECEGFAPVAVPGVEVPAGQGEAALGTVTLSPGAALEGRVRDASGQPVAGAEVRIRQGGPDLPFLEMRWIGDLPRATSDGEGRFTVRDLIPGQTLILLIDRTGYARESVRGLSAPAAAPVEVVLRAAGRVSGRVLDADRKPVEGAWVAVAPERQGSSYRPTNTQSEADGRFEIEEVEPGPVAVEVNAPGFVRHRRAGLEVPAGGELARLELVLEPGATVEGRVTGADGLPVAGAEVFASDPGSGRQSGVPMAGAITDGEGRYRLEGMRTGPASVSAEHSDHARAEREIEVRPGTNALDLAFPPGFEVSGRVVDSSGEPLGAVELTLSGARVRFDSPGATSAADGSFSFSAVPPGSYRVAGRRGMTFVRSEEPVEVRDAPVAGVVVRLAFGRAVLSGRLGGLPAADLAGVRIWATGPAGGHRGQVDFQGTYTVEGLPAGDWEVRAEASGGRRAQGRITIPEGAAEATLDLEFAGGFTLSGRATRDGEPIASADVGVSRVGGRDRAFAVTDAAGAFRLQNLAPGRYRFNLSDRRTGLSHSREVEVDRDLDLAIALDTARIAGTVRDAADGSGLDEALVEVYREDAPAGAAPLAPQPGAERSTRSDSRGYFRFGEVAQGRVRLVATRAGYATAERVIDLGAGGAEGVELELQATEGIHFEAVAASGLPVDRVELAVVDGAGRVVAGGSFAATEGGRVRVSTVPPGSWEMLIHDREGAVARLPVTSPGALGRLQLPPGGTLELTVPDLVSVPAAGTVAVAGPDGRPHRSPDWRGQLKDAWPLDGGRVTLRNLSAGRATVMVTASDGRTWTGAAEVAPGGKAELTLR